MSWETISIQDLGSIGELLAAIATIATLAFLAIQIKQSNSAAQSATEIDDPHRFSLWHARVWSQPEHRRVWDAAVEDFDSLDEEEVRLFRWIVADLFLVFESSYYAFRGGLLSEPSWIVKRDTILGLLLNPIIKDQWDRRQTPFSEEFRKEIDSHRGRTDLLWQHQLVSEVADEAGAPPSSDQKPPATKD